MIQNKHMAFKLAQTINRYKVYRKNLVTKKIFPITLLGWNSCLLPVRFLTVDRIILDAVIKGHGGGDLRLLALSFLHQNILLSVTIG